jgi:hypothetical protein
MRFTGNPKKVQIALAALALVTLWFACTSKRAEAAEPEFYAGAGLNFMSNEPAAHGYRIGMQQGAWEASIVTHGEAEVQRDGDPVGYFLEANFGTCGTFNVYRNKWTIGWGACLWEHGDIDIGDEADFVLRDDGLYQLMDDGIQLTAAIVVRRDFGKRLYVDIFHASTGGSTHYNRGRNLITVGARF